MASKQMDAMNSLISSIELNDSMRIQPRAKEFQTVFAKQAVRKKFAELGSEKLFKALFSLLNYSEEEKKIIGLECLKLTFSREEAITFFEQNDGSQKLFDFIKSPDSSESLRFACFDIIWTLSSNKSFLTGEIVDTILSMIPEQFSPERTSTRLQQISSAILQRLAKYEDIQNKILETTHADFLNIICQSLLENTSNDLSLAQSATGALFNLLNKQTSDEIGQRLTDAKFLDGIAKCLQSFPEPDSTLSTNAIGALWFSFSLKQIVSQISSTDGISCTSPNLEDHDFTKNGLLSSIRLILPIVGINSTVLEYLCSALVILCKESSLAYPLLKLTSELFEQYHKTTDPTSLPPLCLIEFVSSVFSIFSCSSSLSCRTKPQFIPQFILHRAFSSVALNGSFIDTLISLIQQFASTEGGAYDPSSVLMILSALTALVGRTTKSALSQQFPSLCSKAYPDLDYISTANSTMPLFTSSILNRTEFLSTIHSFLIPNITSNNDKATATVFRFLASLLFNASSPLIPPFSASSLFSLPATHNLFSRLKADPSFITTLTPSNDTYLQLLQTEQEKIAEAVCGLPSLFSFLTTFLKGALDSFKPLWPPVQAPQPDTEDTENDPFFHIFSLCSGFELAQILVTHSSSLQSEAVASDKFIGTTKEFLSFLSVSYQNESSPLIDLSSSSAYLISKTIAAAVSTLSVLSESSSLAQQLFESKCHDRVLAILTRFCSKYQATRNLSEEELLILHSCLVFFSKLLKHSSIRKTILTQPFTSFTINSSQVSSLPDLFVVLFDQSMKEYSQAQKRKDVETSETEDTILLQSILSEEASIIQKLALQADCRKSFATNGGVLNLWKGLRFCWKVRKPLIDELKQTLGEDLLKGLKDQLSIGSTQYMKTTHQFSDSPFTFFSSVLSALQGVTIAPEAQSVVLLFDTANVEENQPMPAVTLLMEIETEISTLLLGMSQAASSIKSNLMQGQDEAKGVVLKESRRKEEEKRKEEEDRRKKAEDEIRKRDEEERLRREEKRRKEEEDKKKKEDEERKKREEEERIKREEEKKKKDEEKRKREEEKRRKDEEDRKRREEEKRIRDEEKRKRDEEERIRKEEDRKRKEEERAKREEERKHRDEERRKEDDNKHLTQNNETKQTESVSGAAPVGESTEPQQSTSSPSSSRESTSHQSGVRRERARDFFKGLGRRMEARLEPQIGSSKDSEQTDTDSIKQQSGDINPEDTSSPQPVRVDEFGDAIHHMEKLVVLLKDQHPDIAREGVGEFSFRALFDQERVRLVMSQGRTFISRLAQSFQNDEGDTDDEREKKTEEGDTIQDIGKKQDVEPAAEKKEDEIKEEQKEEKKEEQKEEKKEEQKEEEKKNETGDETKEEEAKVDQNEPKSEEQQKEPETAAPSEPAELTPDEAPKETVPSTVETMQAPSETKADLPTSKPSTPSLRRQTPKIEEPRLSPDEILAQLLEVLTIIKTSIADENMLQRLRDMDVAQQFAFLLKVYLASAPNIVESIVLIVILCSKNPAWCKKVPHILTVQLSHVAIGYSNTTITLPAQPATDDEPEQPSQKISSPITLMSLNALVNILASPHIRQDYRSSSVVAMLNAITPLASLLTTSVIALNSFYWEKSVTLPPNFLVPAFLYDSKMDQVVLAVLSLVEHFEFHHLFTHDHNAIILPLLVNAAFWHLEKVESPTDTHPGVMTVFTLLMQTFNHSLASEKDQFVNVKILSDSTLPSLILRMMTFFSSDDSNAVMLDRKGTKSEPKEAVAKEEEEKAGEEGEEEKKETEEGEEGKKETEEGEEGKKETEQTPKEETAASNEPSEGPSSDQPADTPSSAENPAPKPAPRKVNFPMLTLSLNLFAYFADIAPLDILINFLKNGAALALISLIDRSTKHLHHLSTRNQKLYELRHDDTIPSISLEQYQMISTARLEGLVLRSVKMLQLLECRQEKNTKLMQGVILALTDRGLVPVVRDSLAIAFGRKGIAKQNYSTAEHSEDRGEWRAQIDFWNELVCRLTAILELALNIADPSTKERLVVICKQLNMVPLLEDIAGQMDVGNTEGSSSAKDCLKHLGEKRSRLGLIFKKISRE
ncbi:hypothetical protein BLNAU_2449 [Blattamonas nauphoetae]|uniref:HECT-type E3 ubiquitin transferase n=1 Tax=Blattamonas nauphoetae TaxID=2049346 RepID=A0ABQ9YG48_9EUKA|nr:hypothetical protein BLNAU_2449 [Blattamonas nauphoetae]